MREMSPRFFTAAPRRILAVALVATSICDTPMTRTSATLNSLLNDTLFPTHTYSLSTRSSDGDEAEASAARRSGSTLLMTAVASASRTLARVATVDVPLMMPQRYLAVRVTVASSSKTSAPALIRGARLGLFDLFRDGLLGYNVSKAVAPRGDLAERHGSHHGPGLRGSRLRDGDAGVEDDDAAGLAADVHVDPRIEPRQPVFLARGRSVRRDDVSAVAAPASAEGVGHGGGGDRRGGERGAEHPPRGRAGGGERGGRHGRRGARGDVRELALQPLHEHLGLTLLPRFLPGLVVRALLITCVLLAEGAPEEPGGGADDVRTQGRGR